MKYIKNIPTQNLADALMIPSARVKAIDKLINKAVENAPSMMNADDVNAEIAPHINTPEEAFYAASIIVAYCAMGHIQSQSFIKKIFS